MLMELAKVPGEVMGQLDLSQVLECTGARIASGRGRVLRRREPVAGRPAIVGRLRARHRIPPHDPAYAAGGVVPDWYRPVA